MKTMVKLACIIGLGILSCTDSYAQKEQTSDRLSIGIGYSTSLNGCGEISVEQSIGTRWSISFSAGVGISSHHEILNKETISHHGEFESNELTKTHAQFKHKESFQFSYWLKEAYNGLSLSFGAEHIESKGFDAICGINYRIPLWKQLSADINFNIRWITPLITNSEYSGRGGIKLYYRF